MKDKGQARAEGTNGGGTSGGEPPDPIHHLFDQSEVMQAKLWVGDAVTYEHSGHDNNPVAGNNGDQGQAGASNASLGETNLAAGAVASGTKKLMFAIDIQCGYVVLLGAPNDVLISVNVAGCIGAVIGVGDASGFTATDYAVHGVTKGDLQQAAMDKVMRGIATDIKPLLTFNVSAQQNTISKNEGTPTSPTSTMTIGNVGTFTTQKLIKEYKIGTGCV